MNVLLSDGRISHLALAERVGLSPTPVTRRVKRLEDDGVITGYSALLDEDALGFGFAVFVSVRLVKQIDEALDVFEQAIANMPEVVDCWLMTGERDYLLRVVTEGLKEFEQFLVGRLTRVRGVASIDSSIPLRRVQGSVARAL